MKTRDTTPNTRPDLFRYHEYRSFLKDWLTWLKVGQSLSLREIARKAGVGAAFLSMVISGKRELSSKALKKLTPALQLTTQEASYFQSMVTLGTAQTQDVRLQALAKMKRFRSYRNLNPKEIEVYQYLTHWYFVAIREMTALPDFKLDPKWIQSKLRAPVDIADIKRALTFLTENGFITQLPDGSITPPDKNLDCTGGVYKVALTQYHNEMLELASAAIQNTPSAERTLLGHTLHIPEKSFDQAREILNEAVEKLKALETATCDSIYHAEFALFPLTRRSK